MHGPHAYTVTASRGGQHASTTGDQQGARIAGNEIDLALALLAIEVAVAIGGQGDARAGETGETDADE